jgi:methionine-rich copper-binding protein CopC
MKAWRTITLATAAASAALTSPFACAHASLKSSTPQAGAWVMLAPKEITLTFNEKVEEAFSTITIADGAGKPVAVNKPKADAANPAMLRMQVPLLRAGAYNVSWAVAGRDGHRSKGDFTFTVK